MTDDKIIELARKSGLYPAVTDIYPTELKKFVEFVENNQLEKMRDVFRLEMQNKKT
jgi:hypothetical protein